MKYLLNRKLFELFELFDKKVGNYSLFDFLNPYLNPSLMDTLGQDNEMPGHYHLVSQLKPDQRW
jgi:hypothetical protein